MPKHKQHKQPKVKIPKPQKLPRPKVRDLRMMFKGLLTISVQNRLASLSYALQWYDSALLYLIQKQKLTPDAKKKLEIAVKCRKQAIGTTNEEEQETALLMAVRSYEKACTILKPLSVDKFYDLFKAKKTHLEKKQERLSMKFGNVVQLLQKAIGNKVTLNVADAPKLVQYDPSLTSLSYNREAVKNMAQQFRQEGILAVFVDQLETLSMHSALASDGQGGWAYDAERQVKIQEEMLRSFVAFAKSPDAPKKLVRNGTAPQVKQPKQPGVPGQAPAHKSPRFSTKGPRILGFLVPGTAIATVYNRLMDEQPHAMKDVIAGLVTGDPVGRVKQLGRYGVQKGCLTVTITNDTVQLKHAPGVKPGATQP